ncbi:MAG: hypothetical protein GXO76_03505 [Calditrichaeota bacterium]|nr:hypothetical protein [Calditrichota bacterium]
MLDIIKKSIYFGLGTLSATREKVEDIVDEMIEKGQLTKDQRSKAVKELLDEAEKKEKELRNSIRSIITKILNEDIQVATKKDIAEINKRLSDIEKKLESK